MNKLSELINWATKELNINQSDININNKDLLEMCINKKNYQFITLFNKKLWTNDLINLYLENVQHPIKLDFYNTNLQQYYLLGLLNRGFFSEYIKYINKNDETEEMQNILFDNIENAEINYEDCMYYLNTKEKVKKVILKNRLDLLAASYSINKELFDGETYSLLEGKMGELNVYYSFFNKKIPDYFLESNNYKLYKELINNGNYEYLSEIKYGIIEKNMNDIEVFNYVLNLFLSLPDTKEINKYFDNKVIRNNEEFLRVAIQTKRINYLNDSAYLFEKAWTKENQKLYFEEKKKDPSLPNINTNYSIYINSYFNKSPKDNFYRYNNLNINDINSLNNIDKVMSLSDDMNDGLINIDDKILKEYLNLINNTKSPRIFNLINYIIDKDINNLYLLFNQDGITPYFKECLIYDQDYLMYSINNNPEFLNNINDRNLLKYIKLLMNYPGITKCLVLMKDNLSEYINNGIITRKFVDDLFNENGYDILLSMIKNNEELELSKEEIYVLEKAKEINERSLKKSLLNYCNKYKDNLTIEKVNKLIDLIKRTQNNNAIEIRKKYQEIINVILNYDNPEEKLNEIEEVFDEDNIPEFAKRYYMYKLLYSNNLQRNNIHSPILSSMNNEEINKIVLYDLFRISLGSFNDDLITYLEEMSQGELLFNKIKRNKMSLTDNENKIINRYRRKIDFISKNVYKFKVDKNLNDIDALNLFEKQLKDKLNYPENFPLLLLNNEIIKEVFGYFGYNSLIQVEMYAHKQLILKTAFEEGRHINNREFKINEGDFLKAVQSKYLDEILKNGSVCQEMLGEDANRDATHMDTDMSIIQGKNLSISDVVNQKIDANSSTYGDIKLIISKEYMEKYDECITSLKDKIYSKEDQSKVEVFSMYGSGTHYGIRTGFPSTYIKGIIASQGYNSLAFKIVKNGFYIPIYNSKGELMFSYDDYLNLSKQKYGLKYYHEDKYILSENLDSSELLQISESLKNNETDVERKRNIIYLKLNEVFKKYFKGVKYRLDGNVESNIVEIFDTGSTGRGTNVPNDADFDFIIRVDKQFKNSQLYQQFINDINNVLKTQGNGDSIRTKGVKLDEIDVPIDIDITIIEKTNKVTYSTDECIKDRLSTIRNKYPDKYNLVISNIIMAKYILKEACAYKPRHARKNPQGGLGGVGIENLILQHGGSLFDAAQDFVNVAEKCNNDLSKFQEIYSINDFGENHLYEKTNKYPFDNFVFNMDQSGFEKTINAFKKYINKIQNTMENNDIVEIKR